MVETTVFIVNVRTSARVLGLGDRAISTQICSYGNHDGCMELCVLAGNSAGDVCVSHCLKTGEVPFTFKATLAWAQAQHAAPHHGE